MRSATKIHSSLLIHFFIFLTLVLGLCSSTLEMDSLPHSVLSHDFQWSCWENEMETLLRHLKLFHLTHNESKTYHISRSDLDNFRFLQVPPHLLTLAVQVKTAPCVSRWYKTCETSSIRCQYQATVAARIGFANSQNHCIRICMNLYPVELCAFACLGALNHDRPIIACPDLALWRYCWLFWAKVSGRSMKKLSFSRHETFIIEQEIMLASLGSVWFDEVTHPHKRSSCQKMS